MNKSSLGAARSFWLWGVVPALFCVVVIWYPFGLSMGGLLEEWALLSLIGQHPSFWNSFPGSLMSATFAARPLQITPFFIARTIDPDSFFGFHLLLMIACAARVVAGTSIGYFLFRSRGYAIALGMLFLVFPADTQQMAFRTLPVSLAVALMVCGMALFLRGILAKTSRRRGIAILFSGVTSMIATLIYEPVFTLYALPPLFVLARYGLRESLVVLKRRRALIGAWLAAPVINAAYLYYAIAVYKSAYEVDASNGNIPKSIAGNLHYLIDSEAYRVFYDAWVSSWTILVSRVADYRFFALIAVLLLAMMLILAGRERPHASGARLLRYVLVGSIAGVAGYLPFMVAESHMAITQRTFMSVAPGASLILIAFLAWLCGGRSAAGAAAASPFIFMGVVAQLYQFDQYTRDYVAVIRPYMSLIADRTDATKRVHLVQDSSGFAGHLNGISSSKLDPGVAIRRHDYPAEYVICMNEPYSRSVPYSSCRLDGGTWTIVNENGSISRFSERDVQLIKVGPDFDPTYRSSSGGWRDEGSFSPSRSIFKSENGGPDRYSCIADSMWGYSGFCRGEGWSDGMFSHTAFRDHNWFAAISPDPSLLFSLSPSAPIYRLTIDSFGGIDPSLKEAMKLFVNGTAIDDRIRSDRYVEATIPASALKDGQNEIRFENVLPVGRQLGLGISRIDLSPVR